MHPYLSAYDSSFRDYGWPADVRAVQDRSWQFLGPPNILVHLSQLHKKGTFSFVPETLLRQIRLSLMGQSWMVGSLRLQSQRKLHRHSTCTRCTDVYGPHNELEDRSVHPYRRNRYSGYPVLRLAFPIRPSLTTRRR